VLDAEVVRAQPKVLDERAGRGASREALRRHLSTAPPGYLRGAARNPAAGVGEVLLLLRNPEAPAPLLFEIGKDGRWTRYYRVQRALAMHPRTPPVLGRGLVRHLFWKELVELSVAPHANPVVRRLADRYLVDRLAGMGLGERVALARRAGRGLIGLLCGSDQVAVLRGLLGNPRMVEADAVRIASSAEAPRDFLAFLAEHPRWGRRRDVLRSLVRNERTPIPVALRIVWQLCVPDLRAVCDERDLPAIVRVGAQRRLRRSQSARTVVRSGRGDA
jgi:hypothetical protein